MLLSVHSEDGEAVLLHRLALLQGIAATLKACGMDHLPVAADGLTAVGVDATWDALKGVYHALNMVQ